MSANARNDQGRAPSGCCSNCKAAITSQLRFCGVCGKDLLDPNSPLVTPEARDERASVWQYVLGGVLIIPALALLLFSVKLGSNGGTVFAVPALVFLGVGFVVIFARSSRGKTLAVLVSLPLLFVLMLLSNACLTCR